MHDISSLKAVCDSSAAEVRPKETEPLVKSSPTELREPSRSARRSLPHHALEAEDDTLRGSLSPQSHVSSQSPTHTEVFSAHAEAAVNNPTSVLGHESSHILDQERCSGSNSSLNLSNNSSFGPDVGNTQMPSGHAKHCAPSVFPASNINEIAADDSNVSTLYDWADFSTDLLQPAPPSTHAVSNATTDFTIDLPQPAPPSTHAELGLTCQDDLDSIILLKDDFMPSSSSGCAQNGVSDELPNDVRLGAKRMKKLDALLEMLQTASLPEVTEHNAIVNEMRQLCRKGSFHHRRVASGFSSANLEEPTASSSAAKFAYHLLIWEKYRQEEKRLIREEDLSSISASKEVNARMMKARRRHSKTRDWASDGRKAAKMFFDALHDRDTADRSFALLLLASNVSLDQMLKIAHFPGLRSSFARRFARVVERKAEGWNTMSGMGFAVLNIAQLVGA